MMTIPSQTI